MRLGILELQLITAVLSPVQITSLCVICMSWLI